MHREHIIELGLASEETKFSNTGNLNEVTLSGTCTGARSDEGVPFCI